MPCGTELITGKYDEWNEFKHTLNERLVKKALIHIRVFPTTPYFNSL